MYIERLIGSAITIFITEVIKDDNTGGTNCRKRCDTNEA